MDQTMFNQNQYFGGGYQQPMYGMPQQPQNWQFQGGAPQQQKWMNHLSAEKINALRKKEEEFNLSLSQEEMDRASCNHRSADGLSDALVYDPIANEATCTICGWKFTPVNSDITKEEIERTCLDLVNIIQSIKLMFIDMPDNAAIDFYPVIPMLMKVPKLFEYAANNLKKHELNNNWALRNTQPGVVQMLNNLTGMLGGMGGMGAGSMMAAQQPMYQAPMGAGMPQPMYQAPMGAGMPQPMMNGFGYPGAGTNAPGYVPQNNGFAFQQPTAPTAPATPTVTDAPTAPTAPADTTVTQTVTV